MRDGLKESGSELRVGLVNPVGAELPRTVLSLHCIYTRLQPRGKKNELLECVRTSQVHNIEV